MEAGLINMTTEKLLPCPFCLNEELVVIDKDYTTVNKVFKIDGCFWVNCENCNCEGPSVLAEDFDCSMSAQKEAVKRWNNAWNTRAPIKQEEK